ncbi:MAG: deoxyribonuclease IV [Armatimonadota bacterium]
MRLGVHVRIGGGLLKSLERAQSLGCETVQLFSGNPNAWTTRPVDPHAAAEFSTKIRELGIHPVILHTPYLLNLASPDVAIWSKSVDALAYAVAKAPLLGASIIVTHIGSHKGSGYEAGVTRIASAVKQALQADSRPLIALEMGSGSGLTIGGKFEHIADILEATGDSHPRVGLCIDTAHLWGSGYDISTTGGVNEMFSLINKHIGFDKLKVIHLNDTEVELGSKRDRHFHIGKGRVTLEGFQAILNYPGTGDLPGIIETPAGQAFAEDYENLATLRSLQQAS